MYGIALGYEDLNDHDQLRHDPMWGVLAGKLTPVLTFPSGGDTSYPGMVWHDGLLWISYYSSHEGNTSIYLARVKLTR